MEKTELLGLSAVALSTAIRSGRTTAVEAAEAVLDIEGLVNEAVENIELVKLELPR